MKNEQYRIAARFGADAPKFLTDGDFWGSQRESAVFPTLEAVHDALRDRGLRTGHQTVGWRPAFVAVC